MSKTINLSTLRAFYLTVDAERAAHANQLCSKIFAHFYRVNGVREVFGAKENLLAGSLGHLKMVQLALTGDVEKFEPFVILEDDVAAADDRSFSFEIPVDADAVFIGISESAVDPKTGRWRPHQPLLVDNASGSVDCMRVYNMLSTHAILMNTPQFALAYIVALTQFCEVQRTQKTGQGWDSFTSRLSAVFNVYALKSPIFYQTAQLNGWQKQTKVLLDNFNTKQATNSDLLELLNAKHFALQLRAMTSNGTVSIDICGGMGNQMFIVAAAYSFARRTNRYLLLDTSSTTSPSVVHHSTYWSSIFAKFCMQKDVICGRISERNGAKKVFQEPQFHFLDEIPSMYGHDHVKLRGYFQSLQYFDTDAEHIAQMLSAPNFISERVENWYAGALSGAKSLACVHIRRGDYVKLSDVHPPLDQSYYDSATCHLENAKKSDEPPMYLVFSDDTKEAEKIMSALQKKYLIVPSEFDDVESFYLMQRASFGFIIANSSFSWWAAFVRWQLSGRTLPVVMPEIWFGQRGPPMQSLGISEWVKK